MTLFLEYFLDTEHLGFYNLTIANETLILTCIHEAYILHYDFFPRNILFSPSGRRRMYCSILSHGLVLFTHDPKADFGDVTIHPADTFAYVGGMITFYLTA
jgi:hypothetical protein